MEADTAVAHDAPLAVEDDPLAKRKSFLLVAFFFGESGCAWAIGEGIVLERAFATLVTDRAIERVIG